MTNEEQKRRIYYLQFGDRLHNEDKMIKLRKTPTYGWAYYGLYMALLAAAVRNNGIIRLAGEDEGYETPAHEIAVLIGAERDEVLLVAGMLQRAQKLGMFEITSDDGHSATLQFELIAKYTSSTSQGTVYKGELADKKKSAAAIEDKAKKKEEAARIAKADVDKIVTAWNKTDLPEVMRMTDKRRQKTAARVKAFGVDKVLKAIEKVGKSDFCHRIPEGKKEPWCDFDWLMKNDDNMTKTLEGKYDNGPDQGFSKYMAPPVEEVITDKTVQDAIDENGLYVYDEGYDLAQWDQVKSRYSPEMQAAIERKIKQ